MTVKQLIAELQKYPDHQRVYVEGFVEGAGNETIDCDIAEVKPDRAEVMITLEP